jgi:zinc transporter ZupT
MFLFLAVAAALSDILSGLLIFHPRINVIGTRYIVGFASGIVIATAFFELLPESDVANNYLYLGLGFFTFYILEKAVMLHSCGEQECETHNMGWVAAVGMSADNVVDGIGIAIGYLTDPMLGILITIVVIAHEIPQGITTAVLMRDAGFRLPQIMATLVFAGAMYPFGALLSGIIPPHLYKAILAFVAGSFIYIGVGDLLLEAHRRFNVKVVFSVLFGATVLLVLTQLFEH